MISNQIFYKFYYYRLRIIYRFRRAIKDGFLISLMAILAYFFSWIIWALFLPLSIAMHLYGIRFGKIISQHIGHLVSEIDCTIKARKLNFFSLRHLILLVPKKTTANSYLLDLWRPHVRIIDNSFLCWFFSSCSKFFSKLDTSKFILKQDSPFLIYKLNHDWISNPPILSINKIDSDWTNNQLSILGLSENQWYVCIHIREPSPDRNDELIQSYRNSDPYLYRKFISAIYSRGGMCIRMGDSSSTPLGNINGLIDYAHHPLKSEKLDILLCSKALFFYGNTSGLSLVSAAFGVPLALANLIPISIQPFSYKDIGIPKLYKSKTTGKLLTFAEIFNHPMSNYRFSDLYSSIEIEIVDSSEDEITDLGLEMLNRLNNTFIEYPEDYEMQKMFSSLLKPHHHGYGSQGRIATTFLRRYRHLLC